MKTLYTKPCDMTRLVDPVFANKPAIISVSSDFATPVATFHSLSQDEDNAFLFESVENDGRLARFSFLGFDPVLTISFKNGTTKLRHSKTGAASEYLLPNPITFLHRILETALAESSPTIPQEMQLEQQIPFMGGLVGYLGYPAVSHLEKIERQSTDPFQIPDGHYGLYDSVIVFDHQYRRVSIISYRGDEHAHQILKQMLVPLTLPPLKLETCTLNENEIFANVVSSVPKDKFIETIKKAKEFIREGQVFQVVLSQRFTVPAHAQDIDIYRMLLATNPSPYAYYLKCPGFTYLGSSPETFVRCQKRQVLLRAIAGTCPRGSNQQEDLALSQALHNSEKEMAEHRMLVDLGRNDLGRVCSPGSVRIGEVAYLSKYTHVMHLNTEITGELDASKSCFNLFESCFPAGTVSGAPKVRAMQLLSQLEPECRGIYSGCVGYFDAFGNMDGAIAIRSALIKDGFAHVNAGAGLVFDSDAEMEYEETRNKAKSVIQAIKLAQQGK